MESEYMSKFKQIFATDSVRKSFRDKVEYRQCRRHRENAHHSIAAEMEENPEYAKKETPIVEQNFEKSVDVEERRPPHIPVLDLRPTPSPIPRQDSTPSSGIGSEDICEVVTPSTGASHRDRSPSLPRNGHHHDRTRSRAVQTAARFEDIHKQKGLHSHRECRRAQSAERTSSKLKSNAFRIGCGRSRSPFAAFGLGDRERNTSGKRTFNIKATNGAQIYETAVRAAMRKGYPMPQRSRKLKMLDGRVRQMVAQLQHGHPRFGIKKSVLFD